MDGLATGQELLVDPQGQPPGRAFRSARGDGSSVAAQPSAHSGHFAHRQAADVFLALLRAGQPALSRRLLGRHLHHLGFPPLPAGIHGFGLECGLRLVEPRHRRPHVRLPRRRADRAVGAAGGVFPDQPAAQHLQRICEQGAVGLPARDRAENDRRAAPAPSALPLSLHHEPALLCRAAPAGGADVLGISRKGYGLCGAQSVFLRQRADGGAHHRIQRQEFPLRPGEGFPARRQVDRRF